jgi:hypothetical protein
VSGVSGGFTSANMSTPMTSKSFHTASSPLGPEGRSLMENMPFGRICAGLRHPNHLAAVGGILVFGGLAAIFAGLELGGILYLQHFAAKRLGYASR